MIIMVYRYLSHKNQNWHKFALILFISLFACWFRLYYVTHALVLQPINQPGVRGDAVEYYRYARNLVSHHIFSGSPENAEPLIRDSYRDPGYPLFMAAWMEILPDWDGWYASMLLSQAMLGALTVALLLASGANWMPLPWLTGAGVLMAVWPHSVVITSVLLTETLTGFLCAAGLFLLRLALDRDGRGWAAASGVFFSLAALTNAVMLPLVPLLAFYLLARGKFRIATTACLLASALAVIMPWEIRSVTLPPSSATSAGRAITNLIQGSWPSYHSAYQAAVRNDPAAKSVMDEIESEILVFETAPSAGFKILIHRFQKNPAIYMRWYLEKPALLWGWDIQMGQGDVYVYPTRNSPFVNSFFFRVVIAVCKSVNSVIFLLMLAGCILALMSKRELHPEISTIALAVILVTAVYSLLQAEPRYAIPFRGMEIMLATFAIYRGAHLFLFQRQKRAELPVF